MKKVYVVLAGWYHEGYTDIGMKVFANIDDANKYAKEIDVGDYVEVMEMEVE